MQVESILRVLSLQGSKSPLPTWSYLTEGEKKKLVFPVHKIAWGFNIIILIYLPI